jgi:hypothetical protein
MTVGIGHSVLVLRRFGPWAEAAFDDDKSSGFKKMKLHDLKSMSVNDLWFLHEFVSAALARKISAEIARLNQRLRQLGLDAT